MQHADHAPLIAGYDSHCGNDCDCAVGNWSTSQSLGEAGDRLTREFVEFLDDRGAYYGRNAGYFHDKTEREEIRSSTMLPMLQARQEKISRTDYEAFFRYLIGRMCQIDGMPLYEKAFVETFSGDWRDGQRLKEVYDAQIEAHEAGAEPGSNSICWDIKGPVESDPAEILEWRHRFVGPDGDPVARP
jgi:hypothetical protein